MIFFKELLEKINEAHSEELPFVVYRKPESKSISCWIQNERKIQFLRNYGESGFVMAPFHHAERAVLFSDKNAEIYTCEDKLDFVKDEFNDDGLSMVNRDKEQARHLKLIDKGIRAIQQNQVLKVVLSREEVLELDEFDLVLIFKKLLIKYTEAFVYIWYHPKIGLWIGASPETLIIAKGRKFKTMALAGTKSFLANKEIVWGEKEIKEQKIVTDHIVKELSGMGIEVGSPYNKNAGNLVHICTDIHGELRYEQDMNTLINALHPTAAVCGLPQKKAVEFISANENYNREFYTGFLGEINYKKAQGIGPETEVVPETEAIPETEAVPETNLFVNLRCMQIFQGQKSTAKLYIGGGITSGSVPELEWEETVAKSKVMKAVF